MAAKPGTINLGPRRPHLYMITDDPSWNTLSSCCSSSRKTVSVPSPLTMCWNPKAKGNGHVALHHILWPSPIERWGQFFFLFTLGQLWNCFDLQSMRQKWYVVPVSGPKPKRLAASTSFLLECSPGGYQQPCKSSNYLSPPCCEEAQANTGRGCIQTAGWSSHLSPGWRHVVKAFRCLTTGLQFMEELKKELLGWAPHQSPEL